MRYILFISLALITIVSCKKDEENGDDPNWIRLEIPNGHETFDITGNITDTLLISTWQKTYYTIDQGKTWIESKNFNQGVYFIEIGDTIFAVGSESFNYLTNQSLLGLIRYYTLNMGKTWENYTRTTYMEPEVGVASSTGGINYSLKYNQLETSPGSGVYLTMPTDIYLNGYKTADNLKLPHRHKLLNLHIDQDNVLYIAANCGEYEDNDENIIWPSNYPAVLYISKFAEPN